MSKVADHITCLVGIDIVFEEKKEGYMLCVSNHEYFFSYIES
jgi:hypothetical protein